MIHAPSWRNRAPFAIDRALLCGHPFCDRQLRPDGIWRLRRGGRLLSCGFREALAFSGRSIYTYSVERRLIHRAGASARFPLDLDDGTAPLDRRFSTLLPDILLPA